MIIIWFPDDKAKRRALGFLPGRFSFKSWATGEMMVADTVVAPWIDTHAVWLHWVLPTVGVVVVITMAKWMQAYAAPKGEPKS